MSSKVPGHSCFFWLKFYQVNVITVLTQAMTQPSQQNPLFQTNLPSPPSPPPSRITMDSDEQPDASEPPCSAELCPAFLSVEQHTAEPRSAVQPPPAVDRVVEPSAEHPAAVKHALVLHCTASVEYAMVRPRSVEPPPNEAILQIEGHAEGDAIKHSRNSSKNTMEAHTNSSIDRTERPVHVGVFLNTDKNTLN